MADGPRWVEAMRGRGVPSSGRHQDLAAPAVDREAATPSSLAEIADAVVRALRVAKRMLEREGE